MFIAHWPSGYILGHYARHIKTRGVMAANLLGSLFPVDIKPGLNPWWLNFIFHWSFLIEIGITLFAVVLLVRDIKGKRTYRD